MTKHQNRMKKPWVSPLCKVSFSLPKWYANRLEKVAPTNFKDCEKTFYLTSYTALVTGEVEPLKFHTFTVEMWDRVKKHKDNVTLKEILKLSRKYHFRDEILVKHLLYLAFYHVDQEEKSFLLPSDSTQLQFAYDALLRVCGHEDIEFRDTNGNTSSRYMAPNGNRGRAEPIKRTESFFRDMRLFLNHFTEWGGRYDKEILTMYFDEGKTLTEISELYVDPKTRIARKARPETIYYILKKYRKKMLEFRESDPEVFCDGYEYTLQDKIEREREYNGEA